MLLLRMTPKVDLRYWVSILIASMLGTNVGDFIADVAGLSPLSAVCLLAGPFAAVVLLDRLTSQGSEVLYWLAILVVRAAATIVADFAIDRERLGYPLVSIVLGAILCALVLALRRDSPEPRTRDLPPTDAFYWVAVLVAGSLGTVIGDGLGHAFGPVQIGVPVSAGLASLFVAIFVAARGRFNWVTTAGYWMASVGVWWWGTNMGDILKFLLSIRVSMAITSLALAIALAVWSSHPRPATRSSRIA